MSLYLPLATTASRVAVSAAIRLSGGVSIMIVVSQEGWRIGCIIWHCSVRWILLDSARSIFGVSTAPFAGIIQALGLSGTERFLMSILLGSGVYVEIVA